MEEKLMVTSCLEYQDMYQILCIVRGLTLTFNYLKCQFGVMICGVSDYLQIAYIDRASWNTVIITISSSFVVYT
jgi:hypothetical protein